MDTRGISPPIITTKAAPSVRSSAPVLPKRVDTAPLFPKKVDTVSTVDVQAAEQQRVQAVRNAAQDIANIFVVSDQTFTIFKDLSGQYITRFTSLRDGRVTYIPEPDLFRIQNSGAQQGPKLTLDV